MHEYSGLIRDQIAKLRPKLMDTSRRNPLINNTLSRRTASFIRIVDEQPNNILSLLIQGDSLRILPLPEIEDELPDELTQEFQNAYTIACDTDEEYLEALNAIDYDRDERAYEKQAAAERSLKDRIRAALEMPARVTEADSTNLADHARNHGINPHYELPDPSASSVDSRFTDDALQTLDLPRVLNSRLGRIYSRVRTTAEEKGFNILYMALGYLVWRESGGAESDSYKSPLLLLPVTLERNRTREGEIYSITLRDEVMLNPVLQHKLSKDFGVDLVLGEEELSESSVETFFLRLAAEEPRNLKWRVSRQAVIGIYPFQGIELFNDLDPSGIEFSDFDVVSQLFSGVGASGEPSSYSRYSIDDVETERGETLVPHLVMTADSSQFLALMKASDGQNMAIEGPPGSGKSQTIVNLIANAIGTKKRVLFVAQKGTALQVVLSRLRALELDSLVLPLMGKKADTETFYEALGERIALHRNGFHMQAGSSRAELHRRRDELNHYVSVLSTTVSKTELTVHQVLGLAAKYQAASGALSVELKNTPLELSNLSMALNTQFFGELVSLGQDWSTQLAEVQILAGTLWSLLEDGGRDYRALEALDSDTHTLLTEIETFQAAFTGISLEPHWQVRAISEPRVGALRGLNAVANRVLPWNLLIEHAESARTVIKTLLEKLQQRDALLRIFSVDWEVLVALVAQEAKLRAAISLLEGEKLENYTGESLQNRLTVLDRAHNTNQALLDLAESARKLTGLEDLTLHELLVVVSLAKGNPLLAEAKLFRHAAKAGFEDVAILLEQAKVCHGRLRELNVNSAHLTTHTRIKELKGIVDSAGFLSFLSETFRSAKKQIVELFGLEEYNKVSASVNLEALLALYSQWENNPLASMLGDFHEPSINARMDTMIAAIESLITTLRRHQIRPQRFAAIAVPELLEIVTENSEKLSDVGADDTWELIAERSDNIAANKTAISSALVDDEEFLTFISSHKIISLKDLQKVICNLAPIKQIQQYFETNNDACLRLLGDLFLNCKTKADSITPLVEPLNYFASLDTATREIFSRELLTTSGQITTVIAFLERLSQLFANFSNLETAARALGATELATPRFEDCVAMLRRTVSDRESRDKLTRRAMVYSDIDHHGFSSAVKVCETAGETHNLATILVPYVVHVLSNIVYQKYGMEITQYSGKRLDTLRGELKRLDEKLLAFGPNEVVSAAVRSASPPQGVGYGRKSEFTDMALINNELGKQRRISPSKLIKRARNALLELHPCWMMVPTAVASYLPRKELFDLLIIDEASQMTPEHSISGLMRAKQAIIVGDTNQLPPTNFFRSSMAADEDEDEDLATIEESVLELANMKFHPKHRLQWHYRSRHEKLIAFSNHYVYDNDLVIFPSPEDALGSMGVELKRVDGVYSRGINPAEASVMVESIVEFMECDPDRSLGVVVMNQSQMEQIDAMVVKKSEEIPAVARYIDRWAAEEDGLEAFFVKNLENVQGDERDVIFIGTVYGSDSVGKFRQQLGPINGAAGKRRLNVLFTRAKEKIVTFTSIPMDQFSPADHNEGAKLLKRWLEYSVRGTLGEVLRVDQRSTFGPESPFEVHVIEEIQAMGFEAVPQVGVSNYYIDIGVRHPSYPYGYLCGVECDGASYHSTRSARERDILRQNVLEHLQWNIYRIWSTDWFRDGLTQRDLLRQHLESRLQKMMGSMPALVQPVDSVILANQHVPDAGATALEMFVEESAIKTFNSIQVGTRMVLRYLDGPRAGMRSKFFLSDSKALTTDDDGYDPLPIASPLGQAVQEECEGSVVAFKQTHGEVRVRIEEVLMQ